MEKNKSLTLIELLVVISIIGLLSSIVLVNTAGMREKARIAKAIQFSESVYHGYGDEAVAYWSFNDGLDPTTDMSGNENSADLRGPVYTDSFLSGLGKALDFERSEKDYVFISDSSELDGMKELMVEFWINFESFSIYTGILSKGNSDSPDYRIRFLNVPGPYSMLMYIKTTARTEPFTSPPITFNASMANKWYHVLFSYNGSKICAYLDGNIQGSCNSATGNVVISTNNIVVGRLNTGWDAEEFDGKLDNFRIYTRGLP